MNAPDDIVPYLLSWSDCKLMNQIMREKTGQMQCWMSMVWVVKYWEMLDMLLVREIFMLYSSFGGFGSCCISVEL